MATAVWISQNSFAGGVISEKMYGRVELDQYQDSVSKLINFRVLPHGGITRRSGTRYACEVKSSSNISRLLPFEFSADISYAIEAGDRYFRFVRNGSQVLDGGSPVEIVTPFLEAELFELKYVQSADIMWIVHQNHAPRRLLRYSDTEWYMEPVIFIDGPYLPINTTNTTVVASAATGSVTLTAADVSTITGVSSAVGAVVTTSATHGLVSGTSVTIAGVVGATNANGTWLVTVIDSKNFKISADTSAQSYTSGGTATGGKLFVATDVGRQVRVWHAGDAKWAWGTITGYTSATVVTVEVVENNFPVGATTKWRLGKFSDTTGWPGAVMLYEQRLVFASSPIALQDLDFSQTDRTSWFQVAADETLLASDALSWSLASQSIDNVVFMTPGRGGLAVGTSGGAWIVTGAGGKDDPLTPNSVNVKKHVEIGAEPNLTPSQLDNAVVFVDKSGRRVHEFAYLWQDDSYRAPELTILADHLFTDTTIVDMDSEGPKQILWFVTGDGRLTGLTYMRSEEVVAWHEHTTDGLFKSVCCITEGLTETPYFIIERTVGGVTKKYIEYLAPDWDSNDITKAYHVDSGITFTHSPASATVTGLDHLEGKTVFALADGKVVPGRVVTGGAITLPEAASYGCVGLNFFSDVETLPVELSNDRNGSTVGRVKDLGKINMRVSKSYGCKVGRTFDDMDEVVFNERLVFGAAPALFSGEKSIDKVEGQPSTDVRVCVRQDVPLPFTLSSLVGRIFITED